MRRSSHGIKLPIIKEKDGVISMPHRATTKGEYKGRQVLKLKEKKIVEKVEDKKVEEATAEEKATEKTVDFDTKV